MARRKEGRKERQRASLATVDSRKERYKGRKEERKEGKGYEGRKEKGTKERRKGHEGKKEKGIKEGRKRRKEGRKRASLATVDSRKGTKEGRKEKGMKEGSCHKLASPRINASRFPTLYPAFHSKMGWCGCLQRPHKC